MSILGKYGILFSYSGGVGSQKSHKLVVLVPVSVPIDSDVHIFVKE